MKYKTCVYIGRFQPVHDGHVGVMREGLRIADKLIILIGSSNLARSAKNPWSYEERCSLISEELTSEELERVEFKPLPDDPYDHDAWVARVKSHSEGEGTVLIGHNKDNSSYYLSHFPEWDSHHVDLIDDLNATDIRKRFFESGGHLGSKRFKGLLSNLGTPYFMELLEEHNHIQEYKSLWSGTFYPVIFQTVDIFTTCGAKVLLIKRKGCPGRGLWALPGGFVDIQETLAESAARELLEETGLEAPHFILGESKTFDSVDRSSRGRTITNVFKVGIGDGVNSPHPTAGDDAAEAKWFSFEEVEAMSKQMYEDHYFIIKSMLGGEFT